MGAVQSVSIYRSYESCEGVGGGRGVVSVVVEADVHVDDGVPGGVSGVEGFRVVVDKGGGACYFVQLHTSIYPYKSLCACLSVRLYDCQFLRTDLRTYGNIPHRTCIWSPCNKCLNQEEPLVQHNLPNTGFLQKW